MRGWQTYALHSLAESSIRYPSVNRGKIRQSVTPCYSKRHLPLAKYAQHLLYLTRTGGVSHHL